MDRSKQGMQRGNRGRRGAEATQNEGRQSKTGKKRRKVAKVAGASGAWFSPFREGAVSTLVRCLTKLGRAVYARPDLALSCQA